MKFDYGKSGIEVSLDPSWNTTIFRPSKQDVFEDPIKAIRNAIKNPIGTPSLKKIIKNKKEIKSVCIVVSDATRPVPSHLLLKGLLKELNDYGLQEEKVLVLIATGLHRTSHKDELERILGECLTSRVKIVDHIARDKNALTFLGNTTNNIPIYINKHYYESDLKILTGYVEPHFFFGFSGGRKSLVPGIAGAETILANHSAENIAGIAGAETILANHSAENIASPNARFGIYKNNPMAENSTEIAKLIGVDFVVNVSINEKHEITQIAAGDLERVQKKLVNYQLKHIFKEIQEPFDIVVCGNGGHPLDLNLYQAVKSMVIGEMAVKKNGTIISVNECADGIGGGQDEFKKLLYSNMSPEVIHKKVLNKEIVVLDQWEIQVLTRIMMMAEIYIVSKMKEEEIGNIGLKHAKTVEEAIRKSLNKHGSKANILILPNGPQILPIHKHMI